MRGKASSLDSRRRTLTRGQLGPKRKRRKKGEEMEEKQKFKKKIHKKKLSFRLRKSHEFQAKLLKEKKHLSVFWQNSQTARVKRKS